MQISIAKKNMSTSGEIRKKDYNDEEIREIEILSIYNYTHEDGPGVWDNIFRSLRDGITKEGMLQLISLACHIQDREGKPLMKEKSSNHRAQILTNGTHLIRARSRTRFAGVQAQKSTEASQSQSQGEEDAESKFKVVCYLAACLMRLVTKSPDNFMRSLSRIILQFCTLYRTASGSGYLNSFKFEMSMAEHISLAFRLFPVFKHTTAHHVAIADLEHRKNWGVLGILRFACIQHLEFNGMDVYPQFAELINRLRLLSPALYFAWLRCPANNSALDTIRHIVYGYDPPKEGSTPSRFWVYARIFDRGYFWQLEPKSCKYLLAIQAYLSIRYLCINPEGSDSPLNIPVIKNDHAVLSSAKQMADEFIWAYKILAVHLDEDSPLDRLANKITKEMAEEYVRTHDILSVHLDEAGFIWRSINTSKTDNQVESNIKRPRRAGGPSNSLL